MSQSSTNQMLQDAVNEIKNLRRENELLRARMETFDAIMLVLRTSPPNPGMMHREDIVQTMEKHIAENSYALAE